MALAYPAPAADQTHTNNYFSTHISPVLFRMDSAQFFKVKQYIFAILSDPGLAMDGLIFWADV